MNNLKKRLDDYIGEAPRLTDSMENKIMREISARDKNERKTTMFSKVRMGVLFAIAFTVAAVFILSVVKSDSIQPTELANGTDPNETIIKKVLELQFNGVDERLNELLKPEYRMIINGKEELPEFEKYVEEKYGPYFTESVLDSFIKVFGTQFQGPAYYFGYQLSLKDVTINQHKQYPNRYSFTALVGYQKEGSKEKTVEVKGIALFSTKEAGKIGKFQYTDDNGLSKILNESVRNIGPITFTDGIVYDTLCFISMDVVTESHVEQKNGCTSETEQITDILSRLDKLPTKEPTSEEEIERMEAIANSSNYQIYLSQANTLDNIVYTITVFEDGIIQYDDEGIPGIPRGEITVDAYVDKYNEIKSLLEEFANP